MALQLKHNPYHGINAHLNSFLQNTAGEWESFHSLMITALTYHLDQVLPTGYFARAEKSLQMREISILGIDDSRPQPDVTIFAQQASMSLPHLAASPAMIVAPVLDTLDISPDDYLNAVVIYLMDSAQAKPVTRLEWLSPSNKPPQSGYRFYREKRLSSLRSGLPLVEFDFLHQSPPVLKNLPVYPAPQAMPYTIAVTDPRPTLDQGQSQVYGFSVDDPFPTIRIPLLRQDAILFNLSPAYEETFSRTRFYQAVLDYAHLPLRFESYSPADQDKIRAKMEAIQGT